MIDRGDEVADHRVGLRTAAGERLDPEPLEVEGTLPPELRGVLYRVGPATFEAYGDRYRHWFDGDGMVHALRLADGAATYRCRFVEHRARVEERAAGRRLYPGFATPPPGGPLRRFLRRNHRRNPANTHVIRHAGRLLALCEAGRPHRLDPETLRTLGEEDLGGALPTARTIFSAHPKVCPTTGELWGFGVEPGRQALLHLYRWPLEGPAERFTSVPLPLRSLIPMIHDFAITATSIVAVVAPVGLPSPPLALMLGQRAYGEALRYRPALGGRIAVIDRRSGAVQWTPCDPFLFFHIANAFDDDDDVIVDVCTYKDDAILGAFTAMLLGPLQRPVDGALERLRIPRGGGPARSSLLHRGTFEFPRVADDAVGRAQRVIFGVASEDRWQVPGRPIRLDVSSGAVQRAPAAAHAWAGECVPVPRAGAKDEGDAWLLTVVLDARAGRSELQVLDGADLSAPPVARVRLPQIMPLGFHGSWVADE